jgi:hypothetical protein
MIFPKSKTGKFSEMQTGLQLIIHVDNAIAQAVSWFLATDVWVHNLDSPYGICGEQSGSGSGFSPSPLAFPRQYHSTSAPYSLMYHLGMDNGSISGCSSTEIYSDPSQQ